MKAPTLESRSRLYGVRMAMTGPDSTGGMYTSVARRTPSRIGAIIVLTAMSATLNSGSGSCAGRLSTSASSGAMSSSRRDPVWVMTGSALLSADPLQRGVGHGSQEKSGTERVGGIEQELVQPGHEGAAGHLGDHRGATWSVTGGDGGLETWCR